MNQSSHDSAEEPGEKLGLFGELDQNHGSQLVSRRFFFPPPADGQFAAAARVWGQNVNDGANVSGNTAA